MNLEQQQLADARAASLPRAQNQDATKEQMEAKRHAAEEFRTSLLKAALDPEAFERLRRVALVKPDKALAAENYLLQLCQGGRLQGKIDEHTVRGVLEKVSEMTGGKERSGTIQFRRKNLADSDDEF